MKDTVSQPAGGRGATAPPARRCRLAVLWFLAVC
ncbi:UDP-N-acetylglucosamine-N-acetylmuramyl-(pentapeptide)pyrophosphoryl-undecaprenol-N-acetylglucosamine transferase MurG [Mycobacterium tuberculosis 02_1987]|nr:UDP-N-acetylglucosamine-N-acetylmuramyl-(pentapeptide)pyrophosphoryl-undecaprenol-N-acetylglucosamine transferase MurG [Mycobacterium tuberculosis 02_1987]